MDLASSTPEPPGDFDEELAAAVSRMYWVEDRSKVEIADELSMSRFKVARILDDARRYGVARIEITEPTERLVRLGEQLKECYGLLDARVSSRPITASGGLSELGATAAIYLNSAITAGSSIGLGWGSTLAEVIGHLVPGGPADVVQLAGGFAGSAGDFNGLQLVVSASSILGGTPYLLHAPALVATAEAQTLLRADETVARTTSRYPTLDIMVTGIGSVTAAPASAIYRGNVLSAKVHEELKAWKVIGDTCCHFIDELGRVIPDLENRVTGISIADMATVPLRVAVAGGADKREPIIAALRSGLPNVLITDFATARALLAAKPNPKQRNDAP